jgi:hypothetical protein
MCSGLSSPVAIIQIKWKNWDVFFVPHFRKAYYCKFLTQKEIIEVRYYLINFPSGTRLIFSLYDLTQKQFIYGKIKTAYLLFIGYLYNASV